MRVAFLSRADGTDTRETKICNSLCRLGHEVVYIGWDREPGTRKAINLDPRVQMRLFRCPAGYNDFSLKGWPQFLRYTVSTLAEVKPEAVHARDEPLGALVAPFKHILYRFLILDIFDSLLYRKFPNSGWIPLRWLAQRTAYVGSDRIIETSEELKGFLPKYVQNRVLVIMNVPPDPGDAGLAIRPTGPAVRLCTGGSLMKERDALEVLLRIADRLPPGTVQIRASGKFQDDYSRQVFAKHPAVDYCFLDSPEEFRIRAASCDALTYLDGFTHEVTPYKSWVLPNRFFDAMSIGRPLIVCSRLKISQWIQREQLGWVCEPGDVEGLTSIILSLKEQRTRLPEYAARVRSTFTKHYTWAVMERRLAVLYDTLNQNPARMARELATRVDANQTGNEGVCTPLTIGENSVVRPRHAPEEIIGHNGLVFTGNGPSRDQEV